MTRNVGRWSVLCLASVMLLASESTGQLRFVDQVPTAGAGSVGFGRGAAMVDLDGDGLLDLVSVNAGMANDFFRQRPDHTFKRMNKAWGIKKDTKAHWGVIVADLDNDGDPDVYVVNRESGHANQLLRNDLNVTGTFTDVTAGSGTGVLSGNFGGTSLDYDNDGDLDLFVSTTESDRPCVLLRNTGRLIFDDVSVPALIRHAGYYRHCSSGDYDNDGWMDVAVGAYFGNNRLYRNNGDGTFSEEAAFVGAASPDANFGLVLDDFDNDGWLDLMVPKYLRGAVNTTTQLLRNNGDGTFTNATAGSGLTGQTDMGHNSGDLDADGYPDMYLGTGSPRASELDVLFLIRPDGAGGFLADDVSHSSGVTSKGETRCHGMAIGDYDQDGFVDVYVNNGGPDYLPGTAQENFLWRNQGNANRWTAVELRGVVSNRSAVGAHCVAYTSAGREVHRYHRAGHGFCNTNSPIQHFGIGGDQSVERLEIRWPSGIRQTLLSPTLSTVHAVTETGLQLHGTARIGTAVTLECAGNAADVAEVFCGSSLVYQPLPQFGGIWQLGTPFHSLASLSLNAKGVATADLAIPHDPQLIGLSAYLQAWIHSPGASSGGTLSNLITVTIE